jgi:chromosome segregation ATPase
MLKKDLEDANVVVQDMELELHKKASDLDSAKCEIESLQTVKQSLKTKLKECKRYHSYITLALERGGGGGVQTGNFSLFLELKICLGVVRKLC